MTIFTFPNWRPQDFIITFMTVNLDFCQSFTRGVKFRNSFMYKSIFTINSFWIMPKKYTIPLFVFFWDITMIMCPSCIFTKFIFKILILKCWICDFRLLWKAIYTFTCLIVIITGFLINTFFLRFKMIRNQCIFLTTIIWISYFLI